MPLGFFCLLAGVCAWARVAAEGGVGDQGGGAGREVAAQGASTALRCSQDGVSPDTDSPCGLSVPGERHRPLAGGLCGRTHFTHCVRFVQTGGRESDVGSGLRPPPRLLRSSPPASCPRPASRPVTGGSGGGGVRCESRLLGGHSVLNTTAVQRLVERPCAVDAPRPGPGGIDHALPAPMLPWLTLHGSVQPLGAPPMAATPGTSKRP